MLLHVCHITNSLVPKMYFMYTDFNKYCTTGKKIGGKRKIKLN